MSLLAGIGQGLQGAGQAISQGLTQYALMLNDNEREKMRQASIEKRWAKEDARYEQQQAKDDQRYSERNAKDDAHYQDSLKFREQDANRASAREGRQDEKQTAVMLSQSLERLDSIKNSKAKEIADMFTDPMTKQVTDPEAYRSAMSALQQSYIEDAGKIVQRSGLSDDQVNKYGFSMYLPEPTTPEPTATTDQSVITPAATAQSFDLAGWANNTRQPQPAQSTAMPKPNETKREMAVDYLLNDRGDTTRKPGLLSPETIAQQQERLKQLRESGVQSAYGAAMMPR